MENLQVTRKGAADFVSQADIAAERTIRKSCKKRVLTGALSWKRQAVKPADKDALTGSRCRLWHNKFLHGIPHFAISIAVRDKGKIVPAQFMTPAGMNFILPKTWAHF